MYHLWLAKVQQLRAQAQAAAAVMANPVQIVAIGIVPIQKPNREAGNGFSLVEVMGLDRSDGDREQFRSIKASHKFICW